MRIINDVTMRTQAGLADAFGARANGNHAHACDISGALGTKHHNMLAQLRGWTTLYCFRFKQ